jgi:hypothetical protein
MEIQKEMEQYEAVLKEAGYGHRSLSKSSLGYLNPITQFGFEVWFNAQKQAVPECAEFYLGNGLFAICDWCDFNSVKSFKWNSTSLDSRVQWAWAHDVENGGEKRKKVAMHNVIMKPSEGFIVDHINGNGLDNRRSNLRIVTRQQNTFNSVHKGGTSKYKGVALDKESGLWRAYIAKDGKRTWLGRFPDELSAAIAYDKAAKDMFGEYAKLNIATAQEQNQ